MLKCTSVPHRQGQYFIDDSETTHLELVKKEATPTCQPSACSRQISDHSVYRRTGQSKDSPINHMHHSATNNTLS